MSNTPDIRGAFDPLPDGRVHWHVMIDDEIYREGIDAQSVCLFSLTASLMTEAKESVR